MASSFINVCRFNPTLGGTTDWTYSSAVTGYQSPTAAGAGNGVIYSYRAESADLSQWEVGFGAYNSGTGVFARTTVLFNSAGTTAKINFSTVPQVAIVALAEDLVFREKLIAARTYYVRTDGSDSNTGLVDSAGGAFLTIQKAIDTAVALDLSTYAVTIQIRNGTYTGAVTLKSYIGVGPISIVGDTTTPANVVISVTSANAVTANGVIGAWKMSGMKITTVTTGHCFSIANGSSLTMNGNFSIGPSASGYDHFSLATYAKVAITSNYSIVGSAYEHALCSGGAYFDNNSVTVTITGTPTFTYFYRAVRLGNVTAYGVTYSGAITAGATRYSITVNSILETGGATTSVPGSVAGTTATGGQAV